MICGSSDTSRDTVCQTSLWSTRSIDCQNKRKHVGWIRASGLYSHSTESSVGARQLRWEKERRNLSKFLTRVLPYILDFHVSYAYRACVEFRRQVCRRRFCPTMWVAGSRPRFTGLAAGAFALSQPACLPTTVILRQSLGNTKCWFQFFLCRHTTRSEAGVYNQSNIAKCVRNGCFIRWDTETFQSH